MYPAITAITTHANKSKKSPKGCKGARMGRQSRLRCWALRARLNRKCAMVMPDHVIITPIPGIRVNTKNTLPSAIWDVVHATKLTKAVQINAYTGTPRFEMYTMKRVTLEDNSFVTRIRSYSYPAYSMQCLLVIMQVTYGLRRTNRCWRMKEPTLWLIGLLVNIPQHAARTVIRIMLFMTSATSPSLPSVNTIVKGDCEIVKLPVFKSSVGSKRAVYMYPRHQY